MKILIVDDETLTREGLMSSIDWESLGIYEVYLGDDGLCGLELAKKHKPEIVLSDIRMPKMDGIKMSEQIKEILPDTSIIFMSGYSDKEYLKAAIKLKAINYVEKPLDTLEVEEAILEAVEKNKLINSTKKSAALYSMEKASRLAMILTYPDSTEADLIELIDELSLDLQPTTSFTTIIIKFTNRSNEISESKLAEINSHLKLMLYKYKMSCVYVVKHELHIIYHVYGSSRSYHDIIEKTGEFLKSKFEFWGNFFISIGKSVNSIKKVYHSYSSAVILLQSSFFFEYKSILKGDIEVGNSTSLTFDPAPLFEEALSSKNLEEACNVLLNIKKDLKNSRIYLPNQVRDIYYKLFMILQNSSKSMQLNLAQRYPENESILEYLEEFQTLTELHQALCLKTEDFFISIKNQVPENSTVYLIKDFIRKNYKNENLSVKDISKHVYLSASYVCTLFKTETGQTLNQYITEFRIERARQLLSDPRYKISDISSKVGYTDGNYFSKSFKKMVGLSPSEYREKMTR